MGKIIKKLECIGCSNRKKCEIKRRAFGRFSCPNNYIYGTNKNTKKFIRSLENFKLNIEEDTNGNI